MEDKNSGRSVNRIALERVRRYVTEAYGPVYVGSLSIEAGCSIKQAEAILDVLVNDGSVKKLSSAEKHKLGFDDHCELWTSKKGRS